MIEPKSKVLWERALGWSYDLPHPTEESVLRLGVEDINPSPNYYDEIFLELPRATVSLRGVVALIGVPMLLFCVGVIFCIYYIF
ncbi:MAG: hypothetical protein ACN6OX_10965, partial [Pseudomonas sp.]